VPTFIGVAVDLRGPFKIAINVLSEALMGRGEIERNRSCKGLFCIILI